MFLKQLPTLRKEWKNNPQVLWLSSALGISGLKNLFRKNKKEHLVSLPVAAIARGTVDTAFNAVVILIYWRSNSSLYDCGVVWVS